jgi:intraflagellar transport protein 52
VKKESLSLIPPQFEVPLPPLQPAVFPPILNEPPAPPLDLFDLDEQFASEKVRLAHLTNLCTDQDLEYFIKEAGALVTTVCCGESANVCFSKFQERFLV